MIADEKMTKKLYNSSTVYFVRKNASSSPYIASYKRNIDKIKAGWLPKSPRIGAKNMGKMRENGRVSQVKSVADLGL